MGGGTATGGSAGLAGVAGSAGATGATINRSCNATTICIDYISYPADHVWTQEQSGCSTMGGTWVNALCSGTYCGTCTYLGGLGASLASHYTTACGAGSNLQATCEQGGGIYTAK
jgi:hypothetical protein